MVLYLKHLLIRTPLERPAKWLQSLGDIQRRWRHPELREIYLEDRRIDTAMRRILRPDANCIDVGAHLGSMLSRILQLAPAGKHMAFEPIARKAQWLRRKFPEVDVQSTALSDRDGQADFWEDRARPGFSSLGPAGDQPHARYMSVECSRFDRLAPPHRIDFFKIDVEGAELLVLRGATQTIRRSAPAILFESGPGLAEKLGLTAKDLYAYLDSELDYHIYHLKDFLEEREPLSWDSFQACHQYPFRAFNYLGMKR